MVAVADLLRKLAGGDVAVPVVQHPSYFVGGQWTPTPQQIQEARARQKARRNENAWKRLATPTELESVRAAILCATDRGTQSSPDVARRLRVIRAIAFDAEAEIFERNLRVSADRTLIELRHPRLVASDGQTSVGLRFIRLLPAAWKHADRIGVFLDGGSEAVKDLFSANFEDTIKNPDLVESYVRFTMDHELFDSDQLYLVSDADDFIVDANKDPNALATAQFRMISRSGPHSAEEVIAQAIEVSSDHLIPPTFVPGAPSGARVFTTFIMRLQLYHVCWEVRTNGDVLGLAETLRRRTPEERTLPLVPIRSFAEQVKALKRVASEGGPKENS